MSSGIDDTADVIQVRRRWTLPAVLCVIAIVLSLLKAIAILAGGPSPIVMDAGQYWELGGSAATGDVFLLQHEIVYRTPIYPWFVAMHRWLPASLFCLLFSQGMLWVGTIAITSLMAGRVLPSFARRSRVSWATLAVWLLSLPMISALLYTVTTLSETLFVFLLLLHLFCVQCYFDKPTRSTAVLAGLSYAVLLLTRPIAILMWLVTLVVSIR
ncbi:MAG: hypothetical protein AAFP90_20300, partial [Planctomycetota bacterium]